MRTPRDPAALEAERVLYATVADSNQQACENFPAVLVEGHLVHVYEQGGQWAVWLNCEDCEFTGLCIGIGPTRDAAVQQAVTALEAVTEFLQGPPTTKA